MITVSSQHAYLLKLLRSQGLPIQQLHVVFVALLSSRIIYALPVWGWQLIRQLQERRDAFLKRAQKFGFYATQIIQWPNYLTRQMLGFLACTKTIWRHCLHHLLPDTIDSCSVELRHSFPLPRCKYNLHKTLFHGVCSNIFSFGRFYISSIVVFVHALPVMLAFVKHKWMFTYSDGVTFETATQCIKCL